MMLLIIAFVWFVPILIHGLYVIYIQGPLRVLIADYGSGDITSMIVHSIEIYGDAVIALNGRESV